jgi:hypothetical protein
MGGPPRSCSGLSSTLTSVDVLNSSADWGSTMKEETDLADFDSRVLPSEHECINQRRRRLGRAPISPIRTKGGPLPIYDTVGLALSGGGIRSAAISLGVLQALENANALAKVDYLSTVSGGGYKGLIENLIIVSNDERCFSSVDDLFQKIFFRSVEVLILIENKKVMLIQSGVLGESFSRT